jgi:hypothetical protein
MHLKTMPTVLVHLQLKKERQEKVKQIHIIMAGIKIDNSNYENRVLNTKAYLRQERVISIPKAS